MASSEIAFGSDSFLDVMANMVGILIVLVMVALMRAGEVSHSNHEEVSKLKADVSALNTEAGGLDGEVRRMSREVEIVQQTTAFQRQQRDALELMLVAHQRELEERRQKLGGTTREEYDLRRTLVTAQADLEDAQAALRQKATTKTTTTKIEAYPTPISRTVNGRELHFQLRNNRVTFVPMDELIKLFEVDAKANFPRLQDRSEVVETLGPINGFRLRYTLARDELPVRVNGGTAMMAKYSYGFVLLPLSSTMGETIDQALAPHSEMRDTLHDYNPRQTTVTLWAYPDSFAAFRAVKQELYLLGFSVAGRPLPIGQPIGASSQGTKSSAE